MFGERVGHGNTDRGAQDLETLAPADLVEAASELAGAAVQPWARPMDYSSEPMPQPDNSEFNKRPGRRLYSGTRDNTR